MWPHPRVARPPASVWRASSVSWTLQRNMPQNLLAPATRSRWPTASPSQRRPQAQVSGWLIVGSCVLSLLEASEKKENWLWVYFKLWDMRHETWDVQPKMSVFAQSGNYVCMDETCGSQDSLCSEVCWCTGCLHFYWFGDWTIGCVQAVGCAQHFGTCFTYTFLLELFCLDVDIDSVLFFVFFCKSSLLCWS